MNNPPEIVICYVKNVRNMLENAIKNVQDADKKTMLINSLNKVIVTEDTLKDQEIGDTKPILVSIIFRRKLTV